MAEAVELHFYLVLPIILPLFRRSWLWLPAMMLAALFLSVQLHHTQGEIQTWAYLTLIWCIDQFLLGVLAFGFRTRMARRHWVAGLVAFAFLMFYLYFDRLGACA